MGYRIPRGQAKSNYCCPPARHRYFAPMNFELITTDGLARRGRMHFERGTVETPAFMPVGTQGAVKGVTHRDLEDLGAETLLSNTYHLYLRPGADLVARRGGLHAFIGWSRPILTDSGGY